MSRVIEQFAWTTLLVWINNRYVLRSVKFAAVDRRAADDLAG